MPEYTITWTINIDAENPEEAAREALLLQRDAKSIATSFDITDSDGNIATVDASSTAPTMVFMYGNPVDGFTFVGLTDGDNMDLEAAADRDGHNWWYVTLQSPAEYT